jgi:FkbM family methyltransferase
MRAQAIAATRKLLAGFDISLDRLSRTTSARRVRFINDAAITVVLDVGAHVGEYASSLRRFGYTGRIESFEPLGRAYSELFSRAAADPLWNCHQLAIGDSSGTLTFHVAGNEVSSSALDMLNRHVKSAPESAYVRSEEVPAHRLDDLGLTGPADRVYLKADVQGFEQRILAGAARTLESVSLLEVELSLVELYDGGPLYTEMIGLLADLGFDPIWIEPGFCDAESGRLLQFDGIFARNI